MQITIEFSEDALLGNIDPEEMNLDVPASIDSYRENLVNHLYAEYPDAEIEVTKSIHDRIQIDGMTDHDEVPWIEQIVEKVWNSPWEVYLETD